jgi:hypothetical protein
MWLQDCNKTNYNEVKQKSHEVNHDRSINYKKLTCHNDKGFVIT